MTLNEGKESLVQASLGLPIQEKSPHPQEEPLAASDIPSHIQEPDSLRDFVVSERTIDSSNDSLTSAEKKELRDLEEMYERQDANGSQPTKLVTDRLQELTAKLAGETRQIGSQADPQSKPSGYEEGRIAPGAALIEGMNPSYIDEDGIPVYPPIGGITGRRLRAEGVVMKDPPPKGRKKRR